MSIDRAQFEAATKRRYTTVEIAGLGEVRLQSLTHAERLFASEKAKTTKFDFCVWCVIAAVVDDHDNTIFTEHDAPLLASFDTAVTSALDAAMLLHVFGKTAGDEKKT